MILVRLFFEFFKAGLFAVGGGLATLPFLQEISQKTGWFNSDFRIDTRRDWSQCSDLCRVSYVWSDWWYRGDLWACLSFRDCDYSGL